MPINEIFKYFDKVCSHKFLKRSIKTTLIRAKKLYDWSFHTVVLKKYFIKNKTLVKNLLIDMILSKI